MHDLRPTHAVWVLRVGVHRKVVSDHPRHADREITLDAYSYLLSGLQEVVGAERFDRLPEGDDGDGADANVSRPLADSEELASRP